jgi:hypothetical protein
MIIQQIPSIEKSQQDYLNNKYYQWQCEV